MQREVGACKGKGPECPGFQGSKDMFHKCCGQPGHTMVAGKLLAWCLPPLPNTEQGLGLPTTTRS